MTSGNKIPADKVVDVAPRVLPADHPYLMFYDPNKVVVDEQSGKTHYAYFTGTPFSSTTSTSDNPTKPKPVTAVSGLQDLPDVPQPSDIQIYTPLTPIYDPITKILTYKIVLKIRNSSKDKDSVAGVDARFFGTEA